MNSRWLSIFLLLCWNSFTYSQTDRYTLTNQLGHTFQTDSILTNGNPKVFVFWSSYCKPCKLEMKGMRNIGKQWFEDYHAEIYFVSLENYPSKAYQKLEFLQEFLSVEEGVFATHDQSMAFYHSFAGEAIPKTVLLDGKGTLVQQWNAYDDGMERSVGMYFKKLATE